MSVKSVPKKGYKSVPWLFGKEIEIPEEWETKRVGSISKIKGGKRLPKGESFSKDKTNHPYLRVTDFGNNTIYEKNLEYVTEDVFKKIKNYTISSEDVYISIAGTIGLAGLIPKALDGASLTENACKIIVTKKIIKEYLSIILNSKLIQDQIKSYLGITSQPKLALFRIEKLEFSLPPLPEQQKIASILSNVDNLIQNTDKLIEKTTRLKKGLMQKLLTRGIGHTKFKKVPWYFQKEIEIPEEWKISVLKDYSYVTDGSHFSPSKVDNGFPMATVENVRGSTIDIESCYNISKEDFEQLVKNNCIPKINDVLFTKDGTVGKSLVFNQNVDVVILSSIAIIRPSENLDSYFLHYTFQSEAINKFIAKYLGGTAIKRIVLKNLEKFFFPLPSIPEQQQIASILSNTDEKIQSYKRYKEKLQRLKTSLMQKLLTGEVRVAV